MKSYILLLLPILLSCTLENANQPEVSGNPAYSIEVEARIDRVIDNLQVRTAIQDIFESKSLEDQMAYYHTPGVSIAVINDGEIEWARGFGTRDLTNNEPVDTKTLFEAGSVSKPVFALTVMRLKEKGVLDLDTDVNEYLTSWKVPKNGVWQPKITLRQILSHTAGLTVHGFPGYRPSEPIPTVPQVLDGTYPANTPAVKVNILPGLAFRYSGGGTTIGQLVVSDLMNKPFPAITKQELFEPLGLVLSTYQQPLPSELQNIASTGYPYKGQPINGKYHTYPEMAAAGLWSNPSELSSILIEVQNSLKGNSSLFKKETIEEMVTPQKVAEYTGLGFFLDGKGDSLYFEHGGWDEGFVTEVAAYKHSEVGAVVMINSNEGHPLINEIMNAIAIEYEWLDYVPTKREILLPDVNEIKTLAGIYKDDKENELIIKTYGNEINLMYDGQNQIALSKSSKENYVNSHFNFNLTFKEGEVYLNQAGGTTKFKKQR